jgi:hypothetical protein
MNPFLSVNKEWDGEDSIPIPDDLKKGIIEGLGFITPSKI